MSTRTIPCPHCQSAGTDTVTTAPYIRGYLLAYTYGTKRFVGCNSCVKKKLAGEAGLSLLTGWFSITSMFVNPMCILWNAFRVPFIKADPQKVDELLAELGVGPSQVDLPRVAASLAAAMVAADGEIDDDELRVAVGLGMQLIEGFTQEDFLEAINNVANLPSTVQMAGILRDQLSEEGKVGILKYLLAIAAADGHIDKSEIEELEAAAAGLGVPLPEIKEGAIEAQ